MPCSVNLQIPLAAQLLPPSAASNALFRALWLIPSSRRKVAPKPLDGPQPAARPLDVVALLSVPAASNFWLLLLLQTSALYSYCGFLAAFPLRLFAFFAVNLFSKSRVH